MNDLRQRVIDMWAVWNREVLTMSLTSGADAYMPACISAIFEDMLNIHCEMN